MHKYLVVVILLLLFQSCRTPRPTVAEQSKEINSETWSKELTIKESLKPVYVKADSAMIVALLKCDSTNRVVMAELSQKGTAGTGVDVALKNGQLTAKFTATHDTIYVPQVEKTLKMIITRKHDKTYNITKTVTVKVNELHWWQKWLMWIGGLSLVVVALRITYIVGKRQFKLTI